ncbi:MAG: response regulator, partial [Deltaproteobacteria bacterium]|nr:response regulator [Deltaproteobacteria bacterium]
MLRILIVEDDDELRLSLALSLRRAGHRVLEAGSAAAARPQLANIELLLTDLRLPDDQGTSLLLEGQRLNPQLQTILMTGHATIESA